MLSSLLGSTLALRNGRMRPYGRALARFRQSDQATSQQRSMQMPTGGKIDKAKGRVKEAIGDLTGDRSMKREGKRDRAAGSVKEKVNKGVDRAKDF